jgi:tetratricopeptide (TPR) repeat protein
VDAGKYYAFNRGEKANDLPTHCEGALLAQPPLILRLPLLIALIVVSGGASAAADVGKEQDAAALARKGTAALERRQFGDALDAFTRAMVLQPEDASLCFGAGVAAFMLGQDGAAQTRFERALTLNPDHLEAAVWLGDLHYRAGRLSEAIAIYKMVLHRSARRSDLEAQLATWSKERELHDRFHEVRTEHFSTFFESLSDEPLADEAADRLESAYRRIGHTLGVYPSKRITVVLYTREQFSTITRLASWSAAAYDGRIRLPIAGTAQPREELDRILSHEFVHAVVATLAGRTAPAWLSEGLATVLEPSGSEDAEAPLARVRLRPDVSKLHQPFVDLSRDDVETAYASAARAVRLLIERRGTSAIVALLQDLGQGTLFAKAFQRRIEMRYQDFAALARN